MSWYSAPERLLPQPLALAHSTGKRAGGGVLP
jgi:hypothetical protein